MWQQLDSSHCAPPPTATIDHHLHHSNATHFSINLSILFLGRLMPRFSACVDVYQMLHNTYTCINCTLHVMAVEQIGTVAHNKHEHEHCLAGSLIIMEWYSNFMQFFRWCCCCWIYRWHPRSYTIYIDTYAYKHTYVCFSRSLSLNTVNCVIENSQRATIGNILIWIKIEKKNYAILMHRYHFM